MTCTLENLMGPRNGAQPRLQSTAPGSRWLHVAATITVLLGLAACGRTDDHLSDLKRTLGSALGAQSEQERVNAVTLARPGASRATYIAWQEQTLGLLRQRFGFTEATTPDVQIRERKPLAAPAGLQRELLQFVAADGSVIPAVLQYLKDGANGAGILLIPGHVPDDDSGLRQLVYGDDTYQGAAATKLALAGFTTLTFELRGFGLLGPAIGTEHVHVAYNALLEGSFYKAVVIEDARIALEILRAVPHVERDKIGVTGASLGGELAATLGALDKKISAIAFSSFGGSVGAFPRARGPRNKQRHFCHLIPGATTFLAQEDIVLLLAPRPTLGMRGELDAGSEDAFREHGRQAWRLFDNEQAFGFITIPDRGHDFFIAESVAFFSKVFALGQSGASD